MDQRFRRHTDAWRRRVATDDGRGEIAWYERIVKSEKDVSLKMYQLETLRPIGNVRLHEIDHLNRTATFGIGEKELWGKGYGMEARRLMLHYAFTGLGLHNVMLTVFARNERAIRAYRRAGFREIGRRRFAAQTEDVVLMDCVHSDCESESRA